MGEEYQRASNPARQINHTRAGKELPSAHKSRVADKERVLHRQRALGHVHRAANPLAATTCRLVRRYEAHHADVPQHERRVRPDRVRPRCQRRPPAERRRVPSSVSPAAPASA